MSRVKSRQLEEFRKMVDSGQVSSEALQMLISDAPRLGLEQILRELRDQTEQVMQQIIRDSWCRNFVAANIAKSFAYTRDFELALQRAKTSSGWHRDEALSDIAVACAQDDRVTRAIRILRSIKILSLHALTLFRVYKVSGRETHIKLAFQNIEEIDSWVWNETIADIIEALIDTSALNRVRQIIEKIRSDYCRCLSLIRIYESSDIDDDRKLALQALCRINDTEYKCLALARIYEVSGDSDYLTQARSIAFEYKSEPRKKACLYMRIYEVSMEDSDLSQTLELIKQSVSNWRGNLYNSLASVMIRRKKINNARDQVDSILDSYWRAKTMIDIFGATGEIDDIARARESIKYMTGDKEYKAQILSFAIKTVARALNK